MPDTITVITRNADGAVPEAVVVPADIELFQFMREHMPEYADYGEGSPNYLQLARGASVSHWRLFNLHGLRDSISNVFGNDSMALCHGDVLELLPQRMMLGTARMIELYQRDGHPPYRTMVEPGSTLASILHSYISMTEHAYVRIVREDSEWSPVYALDGNSTRGRTLNSGLSPILNDGDKLYLLDNTYTGEVANAQTDAQAEREANLDMNIRLQIGNDTQPGDQIRTPATTLLLDFLARRVSFSEFQLAYIFGENDTGLPRLEYAMPDHRPDDNGGPLLRNGDLVVLERTGSHRLYPQMNNAGGTISVALEANGNDPIMIPAGTRLLNHLNDQNITFAEHRRAYIFNDTVIRGQQRLTFDMPDSFPNDSPELIDGDYVELEGIAHRERRHPVRPDTPVVPVEEAPERPSTSLIWVECVSSRYINRHTGGQEQVPMGTNLSDYLNHRVPFNRSTRAYILNDATGLLPREVTEIPPPPETHHVILLDGDRIEVESRGSERLYPDPNRCSITLVAEMGRDVSSGGLSHGPGPYDTRVGDSIVSFMAGQVNFSNVARLYVFNIANSERPRAEVEIDEHDYSRSAASSFVRGDNRIEIELRNEERRYLLVDETETPEEETPDEEEGLAVAEAAAPEEAEAEASEDAAPEAEDEAAEGEAAEGEAPEAPTEEAAEPVAPPAAAPSRAGLRTRSQEAQRLGLLLLTYQNGTFGLQDESGNMERVDFTTFDSMEGFLRAFRLGADHQTRRAGGVPNSGNGNGNAQQQAAMAPLPEAVFGAVQGEVPQPQEDGGGGGRQRPRSARQEREMQQLQNENAELRAQAEKKPRGRRRAGAGAAVGGASELEAQKRALQTLINQQCPKHCAGGDRPKKENDGHWWHYGQRVDQTVRCPAEAIHQQLESLTSTGRVI